MGPWRAFRKSMRLRAAAARILPLDDYPPSERAAPPPERAVPALLHALDPPAAAASLRVLVVGVYLADQENLAAHLMETFDASAHHRVTQRWAALTLSGAASPPLAHTAHVQHGRAPRFALLNALIGDPEPYDWVIACDDDVEAPPGFLDAFLAHAMGHDFALCQPARTEDSYIDLPITRAAPGLIARRTRVVEIGPMIAIRRDAFAHVLPFDDGEGMGWGWEFIWARRLEEAGLRCGIIDACAVAHRLRAPAAHYSGAAASARMRALLEAKPHIAREEAFTVLEAYAAP